ncbi:flagellar export protein FliJ [Pokkaliibacter sp. CJK22405]|uniref:flagellar export protein FliJ n=1 Tax=Pokkaliibacter sp. CJK22405 TaxID=3384615 RepID=UPI00398485AC
MARRSQRLALVKTLAERDEQKASQALGAARQREQQAKQQIAQLEAYQEEYITTLHAKGEAGISARDWMSQQQFMGRLEGALEQQVQILRQVGQDIDKKMKQWQQARARVKAIEAWIVRVEAQEQLELSRKEQKALDELVSFYRRSQDN